tara:strand:- start:3728 stop:5443 length:1716 start_codon:yes stop_codon:yes gene_type:complete
MLKENYKCLLISSFNIDNFAAYLANNKKTPKISILKSPFYNQVSQVLLDEKSHWRQENPDFAILWTQPEHVSGSFRNFLDNNSESIENIMSDVDQYTLQVLNIKNNLKYLFIPSWTLPGGEKGTSLLDMKPGLGITNTLMKMNLRMADNFDREPNIFVLNTNKWIESAGQKAFDPKLWFMAKIAFGNDVFQAAVKDIKEAMKAVLGLSKKLIILDLDNTLWGDIVGDVGWQNVRLGGHDYVGESYSEFQRELKKLSKKGIILGIVSKNDEKIALEAINNHPEMILRQDDFAGWKINWDDKAKNIFELVENLNLGLQSVVFIDDSPSERARVRETLAEVYVPEWPRDSMLYKQALQNLRCFDAPYVSKEDSEKTKMYVDERKRANLKKSILSLDKWLETLQLSLKIDSLNESNIKRATQLLNKTNQMNVSTRRMNENELLEWKQNKGNYLWVFHVSDRFGNSGLTGLISTRHSKNMATIVDFILSCRVMGRKVEETMLSILCRHAKSCNLKEVQVHYIPTRKNKPCLDFLNQSGFSQKSDVNDFYWDLKNDYPPPSFIKIQECHSYSKKILI